MTAMKTKLAPRHIIPVVCYAIFFITSALLAIVLFISIQNMKISGEPAENALPLIGLVAVGIAVAAVIFAFVLALLAALFSLFPLIFSAVNISKKNRKLAVACLIFDILIAQMFVSLLMFSFFSFQTPIVPLIYAAGLGISVLSLVMNILNIKHNGPLPEPEEVGEPPVDPIA
jgi:NADH:ubiquinone oxidoreductase subunit 4 (subunit M)